MKARVLLTSALLMFVQIPAPQAQVTVDVVKITCEQLLTAALPLTSRDVILWLSGYYHGKHENTIIEPGAIERDGLNLYRFEQRRHECHGCRQEHGIGQMMRLMLSL